MSNPSKEKGGTVTRAIIKRMATRAYQQWTRLGAAFLPVAGGVERDLPYGRQEKKLKEPRRNDLETL